MRVYTGAASQKRPKTTPEGKHDVLLRVPIALIEKVDRIISVGLVPTKYKQHTRSSMMLLLMEQSADILLMKLK